MNVGRLCSVKGVQDIASHQRGAEYLKVLCSRFPGMGFSSHTEWVGEQMIEGLRLLLKDTRCTDDERRIVSRFLDLASEELQGLV